MDTQTARNLTTELWEKSFNLSWSNMPEMPSLPVISINDCVGAELREGVDLLMSEAEKIPLPNPSDDSFESISELNSTINLDDSAHF
jgi:hypothetical protein